MNQQNLFVPIQMKLVCLKAILIALQKKVIYMITCMKCHAQYVGQTHQKVSKIMNSHLFDICHYPYNSTNVSVHFNAK